MNSPTNNFRNIFLTDDDTDDCLFFSDALKEICDVAQLTVTNNGEELMEVLNVEVPPPPYVIFLDLNMPRKNGFECLEEIRSSPKLMDIPIVVLSTNSNADNIEKSYNYGANFYICKPKSFTLLKKSIETVLAFNISQLMQRPSMDNFVLMTN